MKDIIIKLNSVPIAKTNSTNSAILGCSYGTLPLNSTLSTSSSSSVSLQYLSIVISPELIKHKGFIFDFEKQKASYVDFTKTLKDYKINRLNFDSVEESTEIELTRELNFNETFNFIASITKQPILEFVNSKEMNDSTLRYGSQFQYYEYRTIIGAGYGVIANGRNNNILLHNPYPIIIGGTNNTIGGYNTTNATTTSYITGSTINNFNFSLR